MQHWDGLGQEQGEQSCERSEAGGGVAQLEAGVQALVTSPWCLSRGVHAASALQSQEQGPRGPASPAQALPPGTLLGCGYWPRCQPALQGSRGLRMPRAGSSPVCRKLLEGSLHSLLET